MSRKSRLQLVCFVTIFIDAKNCKDEKLDTALRSVSPCPVAHPSPLKSQRTGTSSCCNPGSVWQPCGRAKYGQPGTFGAGPGRAGGHAQVVASLCRKAKPVSELLPKARISVAAEDTHREDKEEADWSARSKRNQFGHVWTLLLWLVVVVRSAFACRFHNIFRSRLLRMRKL